MREVVQRERPAKRRKRPRKVRRLMSAVLIGRELTAKRMGGR